MDRKVRVRFAPSPTGPLHMGGVRTALYNYLFAKKHNGDFLLRIEDTDQTRLVPGAEEFIVESLKWCGLVPDEGHGFGGDFGPYKQSERKEQDIYRKYAEQLIETGHAYYAFDTPEELDQMRENLKAAGVAAPQYNHITRTTMKNSISLSSEEVEKRLANGDPYVIRIRIPRNEEIKFKDMIRGWVMVQSTNLDDKVLYKSDGMPTYHLANIVDDYLMNISHVIRGEEWLPSAPLHVLLYQVLGWEDKMPQFAHLPLILKPDGNGKLSKRDGDRLGFPVFPIEWKDPETGEISSGYREKGYFPEAFVNILAFLGWNPGTSQELFSMEELIETFTIERVGKAGAKYDPDKARWFNQQYLRGTKNEELAKQLQPRALEMNLSEANNLEFLAGVCGMMKERATFLNDILSEGIYFFEQPSEYDDKTYRKKWKEETPALMREWKEVLNQLNDFSASSIESTFKSFLEEKNVGLGAALPNFRLMVTGLGMGPSMFEIAALLGKEETIDRMEKALKKL
ncbi:glutamate--tRNA ligase [Acidiluteibacter ferrifornacis]|uniref:Glutamate--tRNA ligase n=1 Tax=Acidiluteibacter ferrifornacis TaxID=2692424 RepID=A0A6N9NK66_9FLAO|nr:glutamate--tRNA ligase [Acidiluteibacter ferrifornacis]NBG65035.1 glutamate--tRNA ligase [Acidiluteibacter ferrifornacis]